MSEKVFFSYDEIHQLVADSSHQIQKLDLDCMIAIGGGGFIPGRMLRSYTKLPLYSVSMKLYGEDDEIHQEEPVVFQWIDEHAEKEVRGKNILIVDEVDDTRLTLDHCVRRIREFEPKSITVYVIHSKDKEKRGTLGEDVKLVVGQYIKDVWINYPWESKDIQNHTIIAREQSETGVKEKYVLN